MRQRLPLPAVRRDTLHIVGVGDNRIGTDNTNYMPILTVSTEANSNQGEMV